MYLNEKIENSQRNFTFQSGYIQINMSKYKCQGFVALHSNLVIFKLLAKLDALYMQNALHSNLVIFKLSAIHLDKFSDENFTFQSGYIQMHL